MSLPIIPTLSLLLLLSLALYRYIIHPAFLSPLSKIPPAHWSAPFSRLWILSYRYHETETPAVHAAHERLGPIILIAPGQISINCVDGGIRTVYSGGYEKGDWYQNLFTNYGVSPMFSMPDHTDHAKRRRIVSNVYAKSTLQSSAAFNTSTRILLEDRLIPRLRELGRGGKEVEFYDVFTAIITDFVTAYVFGLANSTNFMNHSDLNASFFRKYKESQRYQFWSQDLPKFTAFLGRLGLRWLIVPKSVDEFSSHREDWILRMCNGAEAEVQKVQEKGQVGKAEHWPTVYAQCRNALLKESTAATKATDSSLSSQQLVRQRRFDVASEVLDHVAAGFDTSSITLTFFAWELSKPSNTHWQTRLREEVLSLSDKHDAKAIDALPILHATLMETLRLHAAIPGNEPRVTPPNAVIGPPGHEIHGLPAGTRVQSQAWSLHRNPTVFPDPLAWKPERWLEAEEAQHKEMMRWFWAFGSGGRMCVGSNLAMYDMKAIITAIWSAFETEVVFDEGMVHRGGYVAEPVGVEGKFLRLRVGEVK